MDSVCNMTVIKARLEKKLVEVETFVETSQLERVPPSPPLRAEFPLVSPAPPAVGLYDMPAPGMPTGISLRRQADIEQA